jgi:dipeptidyl aminopeptidase/acylaminoacyl peptidase
MSHLIIGLLLIAGAAVAAEPRDMVFRSKLDGSEQRYVELLPPNFDSKRPHDAVIALHGHGADRWQFIRDERGECRGVRDVAAEQGLIVISPDYRGRTSWMGPAAEADVVQIIAELRERHAIDRVFVAGGSMGGTSALIFAMLHPTLIAGVCSLNGTANMLEFGRFQDAIADSYGGTKDARPEAYQRRSAELWPEKFTMPVAVTTGGKDEIVPPPSILRLVEKLRQAKRPVLSLHRENGGHATNYEDTRAALEYLLSTAAPGIVER